MQYLQVQPEPLHLGVPTCKTKVDQRDSGGLVPEQVVRGQVTVSGALRVEVSDRCPGGCQHLRKRCGCGRVAQTLDERTTWATLLHHPT